MLKKSITYEDFNGEETTEVFFFNLSKAELVEMELSHEGGLADSLKKIAESEDGKKIIEEMKNIILGAYGKKSIDGKRFVKNATIREEFESSEAYSVLFMELVTDADAAVAFIQGVIPAGMGETSETPTGTVTELPTERSSEFERTKAGATKYTRAQVEAMSNESFMELGDQIRRGEAVIVE